MAPHRSDVDPVQDATRPPASPAGVPGSPLLQRSLEMGETIGQFLTGFTQGRLAPDQAHRLHRDVRAVAARAAYGGLALWAVSTLAPQAGAGQRLGEAIAGVGLGLLGTRPMTGGTN